MNHIIRRIILFLDHFPRFKNFLKFFYYLVTGIPPEFRSEINRKILHECIGKNNPVILEIGCNDGSHTRMFLEIFKNPTIYCFEPDPRAIERFKKNIGHRPNVTLFTIALSDRNGECDFYPSNGQFNEGTAQSMPQGWDLSGSIRQPKNHLRALPWITFDSKITVETSTLDDWSRNHGIDSKTTIDFIWMDVQGAEIDVFRGGKNTLAKTRYIYTEYSNIELYEGQFPLLKLVNFLKVFHVIIRYPEDVLLANKRFLNRQKKELRKTLVALHEKPKK